MTITTDSLRMASLALKSGGADIEPKELRIAIEVYKTGTAAKPERLIKFTEVAETLSCTRQHVYKLVKRGDLQKVTAGIKCARIPQSSLDAYLNRLMSGEVA